MPNKVFRIAFLFFMFWISPFSSLWIDIITQKSAMRDNHFRVISDSVQVLGNPGNWKRVDIFSDRGVRIFITQKRCPFNKP